MEDQYNKNTEEANISVVTAPTTHKSQVSPIRRFIDIIGPSSSKLTLFGGGVTKSHFQDDNTAIFENIGDYHTSVSVTDYIILQVSLMVKLFDNRKEIDLIYFHKGAMGYWIGVLSARIIGINTCVIKVGAFAHERVRDRGVKCYILSLFQYLSFYFSNAAVVFSESEVETVPNNNCFVAFSNYRDFSHFKINTDFSDRDVDIGFVGGFSEVNGIKELTLASQLIKKDVPDVKVRFVGDGPLFEEIKSQVENEDFIELAGWVQNENVVDELNNMKFVFMPSLAEGLPTTAIEAMACGAIVVATPVGSLDDIIKDGEVGFVLENSSPKGIASKYHSIKNYEDVGNIIENQREYVKKRYSLPAGQNYFAQITSALL